MSLILLTKILDSPGKDTWFSWQKYLRKKKRRLNFFFQSENLPSNTRDPSYFVLDAEKDSRTKNRAYSQAFFLSCFNKSSHWQPFRSFLPTYLQSRCLSEDFYSFSMARSSSSNQWMKSTKKKKKRSKKRRTPPALAQSQSQSQLTAVAS